MDHEFTDSHIFGLRQESAAIKNVIARVFLWKLPEFDYGFWSGSICLRCLTNFLFKLQAIIQPIRLSIDYIHFLKKSAKTHDTGSNRQIEMTFWCIMDHGECHIIVHLLTFFMFTKCSEADTTWLHQCNGESCLNWLLWFNPKFSQPAFFC